MINIKKNTIVRSILFLALAFSLVGFVNAQILIDAERLNESRDFISNVYSNLSNRDEVWQMIPAGDFLRINISENITKNNFFNVYAKSNGTSRIEIYEKDGSTILNSINNINEDSHYVAFLVNLTGSQDTFDLKIL